MNRNEFRRCVAAAVIGLLTCVHAHGGEPATFTRGYIYVTFAEREACDFGGREWIVEVDPSDGSWRIFADSDDGICGASGLRFTPSGDKLLVVNFGHIITGFDGGWIQAFNPDGTSEVILDASDGLRSPSGANALDFDRDGNLYIVSGDTEEVLRFPAGGGVATVFADSGDGIVFQGALAFVPTGDLFFSSHRTGTIVRIEPTGASSTFDTLTGPITLDADALGNLYTLGRVDGGGGVLVYDQADQQKRRTLASEGLLAPGALATSPSGKAVYVADLNSVKLVDSDAGIAVPLADVAMLSGLGVLPYGMSVYAPSVPGDLDWDGDVDLRDAAFVQRCWHEDAEQAPCLYVDLDASGSVTGDDLALFAARLSGPGPCAP